MDRLERDFYAIEEDEQCGKRIHIFGYAYHCDDETEDKQYRFIEFTFNYIPVGLSFDEFTRAYKHNEACCKQYNNNYNADGIIDMLDNYFDESPAILAYENITPDTPCGYYIQP